MMAKSRMIIKRMNYIYFQDKFMGRWQNRVSLSNRKEGRMQTSLSKW